MKIPACYAPHETFCGDCLRRLIGRSHRLRTYESRAQTQENANAQVTVAVLDAIEAARLFGVPLARRGIQPVYLRIVNRSNRLMRLQLVRIDPNYYTPLEAAAANHFSIVKRLSAFGLIGILFLHLLVLIPFKLISAYRANRRMDDFFSEHAFHLRPIPPGGTSEGFVFTSFDAGTKIVHVSLHATGDLMDSLTGQIHAHGTADADNEFTFSIPVPGIAADYLRRDFETAGTYRASSRNAMCPRLPSGWAKCRRLPAIPKTPAPVIPSI